jgi:metal-dependent amidase/aminoacylase/carboxypeptidase family protein
VVLCREYDGLPGLGHGCEHNVMAASSAGAAAVLATLAERHLGRVTVLETPAEEVGGGKIGLLHRGAFDGEAAALLADPGAADQVRASFRSAAGYRVSFIGRDAHAAMAQTAAATRSTPSCWPTKRWAPRRAVCDTATSSPLCCHAVGRC